MKRLVILVPTLFVALLTATIISAAGIEITLEQDTEFFQGELLQAEIAGAFIDELELSDIGIYNREGSVHSPSPTSSSNLYKTGNKYLYYAVLPYTEGNFSLEIRDAKYYIGQETSEETVALNITIEATTDSYISPSKGFILATDEFEITVKSLNAIQEVTIDFKEGESQTKEIGYNQEKTFKFTIEDVDEYTESSLDIEGISIPLFITPITSPPQPFINGSEQDFVEENDSEVPAPEEVTLEDATTEQIQTCADIEGMICKSNEVCKGPTTFARGVVCCTGECKEKSSTGWIWGIALLLGLAGGLYWYYDKAKKQSKPRNPKQELEERSNRFKERIHPKFTEKVEVTKSLARE